MGTYLPKELPSYQTQSLFRRLMVDQRNDFRLKMNSSLTQIVFSGDILEVAFQADRNNCRQSATADAGGGGSWNTE